MADKPSSDAWHSVTKVHGSAPTLCRALALCPQSGPARATAREMARQRHIRFVQALRIPHIRHPLPDLLIWRPVAEGRA